MDSLDAYVYWFNLHLLAMNIKEEEKYDTILLLLNISKNEKHPEKAPASNSGRVGVGV